MRIFEANLLLLKYFNDLEYNLSVEEAACACPFPADPTVLFVPRCKSKVTVDFIETISLKEGTILSLVLTCSQLFMV